MNRTILQVPKGIRYISEYEEGYGFHLEDFPYILDKKIPGCGFTTWALTNSQNIILASPRKILLENKKEQLGDGIFLVKMQQPDTEVDKDLNKVYKGIPTSNPIPVFDKAALVSDLANYFIKMQMEGKPFKIIVTYDSYRKVKEILAERGMFQDFYTIVDEFQSLWVDARFKASTEIEFLEIIKTVQRVCYVSATPMMEEYLELIDYFKDLPYYELDWGTLDPGRIKKPKIIPRTLKSVNVAAKTIITPYLEGKFDRRIMTDPKTGKSINVESREAVIYVNSITNIIGIIKACELKPDDVCILCSDTPNNRKRIEKRLNRKREKLIYNIEKVPLPGEPRKMITLCTRTVYLGADFYSDNARTFILSDANIDTLAVDITLDLPQILGRQRLASNPWKDEAILYVKALMRYKATSEEDFKREIEKKLRKTQDILNSYSDTRKDAKKSVADNLTFIVNALNYRNDYVAVNLHSGSLPEPIFNHLVAVAEKRAFDIQQKDYADRFTVFNRIAESGLVIEDNSGTEKAQQFLDELQSIGNSTRKMEFLCVNGGNLSDQELEYVLGEVSDCYRNFYLGLGPDRCRALGYSYSKLKRDYDIKFFSMDSVKTRILELFPVGMKIGNAESKQILENLYKELGYKKTPKTIDLEEYFETKTCKVKDPSGKWINGIEILGIK